MERFIDIHSHILPGIDDGANGKEQAERMLGIAAENKICKIIATPHYVPGAKNVSPDKKNEVMNLINNYVKQNNIDIEILPGNEIYYRSVVPKLLEEGKISTLAGSAYVLIEFNPMQDYCYIRDAVYNLHSEGYRPILAHTERYSLLMENKQRVKELIGMGAYIQINAGSICRKLGNPAKKDAAWMLNEECVHFIATDAHNEKERAPYLLEAADYIERKLGKQVLSKLLIDNPGRIINNQYI